MTNGVPIIILLVVAVAFATVIYFLIEPPDIKTISDYRINVTVDAIYDRLGEPSEFSYSGIVISTNRYQNVTSFVLADEFIADVNGNVVLDPDMSIRVGSNIEIEYNETYPICSINVTFDNGTKIIGYKDRQFLNNNTSFNKTLGHIDDLCFGNSVVRHIISWQVVR